MTRKDVNIRFQKQARLLAFLSLDGSGLTWIPTAANRDSLLPASLRFLLVYVGCIVDELRVRFFRIYENGMSGHLGRGSELSHPFAYLQEANLQCW